MKVVYFIIVFWGLGLASVMAQNPFVSYNFDNCDASGSGQAGLDGSIHGSVDCVCGLIGESLELNGQGDTIKFPKSLVDVFASDFTIDFYFSISNVNDVTDILSYRNSCNTDSLLSLKYYPASNELLLEMAKNIAGYQSIITELSDKCWHRFTLTRNELVYTFYLDNERAGTILPNEEIPMSPSANMAISGSPCLATNESPFNGRVDEFNIYTRAISQAELRNNYLFPNQIINRDTTIFTGEVVDIEHGASCHSVVSWSPTVGLDDATILNPSASPTESTNYILTTSDGKCTSTTDINIFVVDPDEFNCEDLLLPSAFTPNGDQLNDFFGISNTFIVGEIKSFYIMDKWGNKVFETNSKNDRWDGTYGGKRLPPGTFTYVVSYTCQGEQFNKIGTVVLLA